MPWPAHLLPITEAYLTVKEGEGKEEAFGLQLCFSILQTRLWEPQVCHIVWSNVPLIGRLLVW